METEARELAARLDQEKATGQPTRGQRFAAEAGEVLDQADAHVAPAREHRQTVFANPPPAQLTPDQPLSSADVFGCELGERRCERQGHCNSAPRGNIWPTN
ncbi:hypothetical protein [Streptomyces sp. NPDC002324]